MKASPANANRRFSSALPFSRHHDVTKSWQLPVKLWRRQIGIEFALLAAIVSPWDGF
jgi:hypothetical protein